MKEANTRIPMPLDNVILFASMMICGLVIPFFREELFIKVPALLLSGLMGIILIDNMSLKAKKEIFVIMKKTFVPYYFKATMGGPPTEVQEHWCYELEDQARGIKGAVQLEEAHHDPTSFREGDKVIATYGVRRITRDLTFETINKMED